MKNNVQKILSIICIAALLMIMPGSSIETIKAAYLTANNQENTKEDSDNILGGLLKPVFVDVNESAAKYNSNVLTDRKYSYSPVSYQWEKYADTYYYNQLSTDEQILYDRLDEMCINYLLTDVDDTNSDTYTDTAGNTDIADDVTIRMTDYITCSDLGLTSDEVKNVLLIFNYANPQYYFIANYYAYNQNQAALSLYDIFSDGTIRSEYTSQFQSQITQWENSYSSITNIYDKEKAIHDLICNNVSYDHTYTNNIYNQSSASAVLSYGEFSHKTVCAGYAKTFELLCNSAGIETINITSETHEWNKVRLYNNWYNVDCTWDDQASIIYNYFNKSDTTIHDLDQDSAHVSESLWSGLLPVSSNDFNSSIGIISNYTETPEVSCQTVDGGKQITLTDAQNGADIYYTTNGNAPQQIAGQKYSDSFTISTSCTVKTIAVYNGNTSSVKSVPIEVVAVSNPTIISNGNTVSISCSLSGAKIYYTTDGSIPSVSSNLYKGSFAVSSVGSVKTIAVKRGYANSDIMIYQKTATLPQKASTGTWDTVYNGVDYSTVYNKEYYLSHNSDLQTSIGDNSIALLSHFINFGMSEGRQACETFDVNYYKSANSDLRSAFDNNFKFYYYHFMQFGYDEGRQATKDNIDYTAIYKGVDYSAIYNKEYYKNRYPDLVTAYGNNTTQLIVHFLNYGMDEGRWACSTFNVASYIANYSDLRAAYLTDVKKYYLHYFQYGVYEGRTATGSETSIDFSAIYNGVDYSAIYNKDYYLNKYSDLKNAFGNDSTAIIQHFLNFGMNEGRQACSTFNVATYIANYSDLRAAFSTDVKKYYLHYLQYGVHEGRIAT